MVPASTELAWPPSFTVASPLLASASCHSRMPDQGHAWGLTNPLVAAFSALALKLSLAVNVMSSWHCAGMDGQPGPSVEKIMIRASTPVGPATASSDGDPPDSAIPP